MENLKFCKILTKNQGLGLRQKIEAMKSGTREFYNECFVREREGGAYELISKDYKDRAYVLGENVIFCEVMARNLQELREFQQFKQAKGA